METSAGEPIISMRPFAVTKCSAWLVSKDYPRLLGSLPSYIKSATISFRTPSLHPLRENTKKHSGYESPLFPISWEDKTDVEECLHMVKLECNVCPVSRHEPLDTTPPPSREIGQQ